MRDKRVGRADDGEGRRVGAGDELVQNGDGRVRSEVADRDRKRPAEMDAGADGRADFGGGLADDDDGNSGDDGVEQKRGVRWS